MLTISAPIAPICLLLYILKMQNSEYSHKNMGLILYGNIVDTTSTPINDSHPFPECTYAE